MMSSVLQGVMYNMTFAEGLHFSALHFLTFYVIPKSHLNLSIGAANVHINSL